MRTTQEILVTAKSAVTEIRNYTPEQIDAALTKKIAETTKLYGRSAAAE